MMNGYHHGWRGPRASGGNFVQIFPTGSYVKQHFRALQAANQ